MTNKKNYTRYQYSRSPQENQANQPRSKRMEGSRYWGEPPDVSIFFGRKQELKILKQWINKERCRLVIIVGMGGMGKTWVSTKFGSAYTADMPSVKLGRGGIGKTDLSVKLAYDIEEQFEYVIWLRLLNAPKVTDLLTELIEFLSYEQDMDVPEVLEEQIPRLLHYLRQHRCLVILDNVETLLREGEQMGHYRDGYEGYGQLFRGVAETDHQSCFLLTTREIPADIVHLEGESRPVRVYPLEGLDTIDVKKLFKKISSFSASEEEWDKLNDLYNGNPFALELAAHYIRDVFTGDVAAFLKQEQPVFEDLHELLDWHFNRLSKQQKEIMYWFAIYREPMTIVTLKADISFSDAKEQVPSTLNALQRSIPLEKSRSGFTLQPVLIEYMTEQFIKQVVEEITSQEISLLNTHSPLVATATDYVRDTQRRLILQPITERLLTRCGGQAKLEAYLQKTLSLLHEEYFQISYAAGNLLNLLCQLHADLSPYDFSHLLIRQAYLQGANLQRVNFAHASFEQCLFTDTFGGIDTVTFSPDATMVAAGTTNGDIRIWNVADGTPLTSCKGHTNTTTKVAFSPDGDVLASGSLDKTVHFWDVMKGKLLHSFSLDQHQGRVQAVAFSRDGQLAASCGDDRIVRVWDTQTGACVCILEGHTKKVFIVVFSPDGQLVASLSADRTVKIWEVSTGACLQTIEGYPNAITFIGQQGTRLALAFREEKPHRLECWEATTGQRLSRFEGLISQSQAFNEDGTLVAGGSPDGTVRIWNAVTGECLHTLQGHTRNVRTVAFSADGTLLVSGSDDRSVRIWDVKMGQCLRTMQGYSIRIRAVAFSPDGKLLASGGEESVVRLWEVETGRNIASWSGHDGWLWAVAFHPDGKLLASGSDDQTIRLWNVETGECIRVLDEHVNWVTALAFSPDGALLASGSHDRTIRLWDARTGAYIRTLLGHDDLVWAVDFSPDGTTLLSASEDMTARLWDVQTGACLHTLPGHTNLVWAAAFGTDGVMAVTGSDDTTIRLWHAQTGEHLHTFQDAHTHWIRTLAVSPDGATLASGSDDTTIRLWHLERREPLRTLYGHRHWVRSVAFSRDGTRLASGSYDGTIKLWNVAAAECLHTLRIGKPYEGMNIIGITGLTETQKATLKILGAIEEEVKTGGRKPVQTRDQVFISYSREDKDWLDKLKTMLKPLERKGLITTWSDDKIEPGTPWEDEINRALASAKVAVLLVTPAFLASDFIDQHELPPLLEGAKNGGLVILWIAVSASNYKVTEIKNYQAANEPSKPLDSLTPSELSKELVRISEIIQKNAGRTKGA